MESTHGIKSTYCIFGLTPKVWVAIGAVHGFLPASTAQVDNATGGGKSARRRYAFKYYA